MVRCYFNYIHNLLRILPNVAVSFRGLSGFGCLHRGQDLCNHIYRIHCSLVVLFNFFISKNHIH